MQLVTRLNRERWTPTVYCLSGPGGLVSDLEAAGVPCVCLGARSSMDVGIVWRLARELRRTRPQLLQTFLFHANFVGRLAARLARVPRVVSGIRVAERRTRTHLRLDRLTQGLVDRNVCVSTAVAEFAKREAGLKPEKTVVIPNGVDVEQFADAVPADLSVFGIRPGAPVMIAVGRLDPQKGVDDLIAAFALRQPAGWHLLLVGEGPLRQELSAQIRRAGLSPNVHLVGWRNDVSQLLRAADCLVHAALWEGMPNVVLEAMAAGLPVIATRVEGVEELVIPGETGLIVPPKAPADLSQAIAQVAADPELRRRFGAAGQRRARDHFSWDATVAAYTELYSTLLG